VVASPVSGALNNIFVAAHPVEGITKPIAFLAGGLKGPTDGNTCHRVGPSAPTVQAFIVTGDGTKYFTLAAYHNEYGWEGQGWLADPTFVSYDTWAGYPFPDDDLRLRDGNVATWRSGWTTTSIRWHASRRNPGRHLWA
jgi:hypothetical protein